MTTSTLVRLELLSAATFGRGDGVAGLVDREVEHDSDGFPFLRGRTLKGLLAESAEDLVFAFEQHGASKWLACKDRLFGQPGSDLTSHGIMHVSDACLPENLRRLFLYEISRGTLTHEQVFEALTSIRRQTAMNPYGAPERGSLRSMRVILRGAVFEARLSFDETPTDDEWAVLAGSVLGLRAAGTGRNRGRGRVYATLNDEATTRIYFAKL